MKSIGSRLKEARKRAGLKQKDLAKEVGVSAQAVSGWERGVTFPQVELYASIANALHCSKDELFFATNTDVASSYRCDVFNVPFYDEVKASAGIGFFNSFSEVGSYPLPVSVCRKESNKQDIIAIRCIGDSMEPIISDGSILAINTSIQQVKDGGIYVVNFQGSLRVKRLYQDSKGIVLSSYNKDYPSEKISNEDLEVNELKIVGKVFWYSSWIK
ncbi:helix-turn-helix transcriptional regulator [Vibrio mediterranei]|uniref:S24 family peptidase n=1 Tax=Vibrio mediterranei TaxID=689 RepID=UPI001EFD475C|nr:helix-turn-helix transcriptional regulator [Vibrio mediterranei]MCG9625368.1 helix-turn-helix transcriptional regulator [Vibrio mediterranei]